MNKIVFIDRDGVINVDLIGDYVKTWAEFRFEKGAVDALKAISDLGYDIILISNQAGVGDGIFLAEAAWGVHQRMVQELRKNGVIPYASHYCLHGKEEGCSCRKPETGLFEEAVKGLKYDPSDTFMIGDKVSDIEAGKRFGLRTMLVRTGYGQDAEKKMPDHLKPDYVVEDLKEAAKILKSKVGSTK